VAARLATSIATTAESPLDASESAFQAGTTTNADRQSKHRDRSVSITRVAASTRLGFTPRSRYSASWRRRNRISAPNDSRGRSIESTPQDQIQVRRTIMQSALSTP
jgi:hypothetical protein